MIENLDLVHLIASKLMEEETLTNEQIRNLVEYGTLTKPEENIEEMPSTEVSTAEVLVDDITNVPLESEIEISKEGMVTTPTDETEWNAVEQDSTNE